MLTLYRLNSPTNCKMYDRTFKNGTTIVKGTENEDRIEVIVETYIELQAPPEQIVIGIDKDVKTFSKTSFIIDGPELASPSQSEKKM